MKTLKKIMAMVPAIAIADRLHQLFVPGRAGRFSDVLIDSSGAALIQLLGPLFWRHDNEL